MALTTVSSDRLSTNVKNTNFTSAEKQDLTDDILPLAGQLGNRNLIINGAMQVAQRGTSSTSSSYATVDRFGIGFGEGSITQAQVDLTSSDTPYASGFRKAFKLTNSTASTAAAAARDIRYQIEAQDIATSGWDSTSTSSNITLSFWVRSSVAQTYYCFHYVPDSSKHYVWSFALSANTWTKVTKTIPGASGVTFNNDNGPGMSVQIVAFYGTNLTASGVALNAWGGWNSSNRVPDMTTTWGGTTNATFEVTGLQLEVGSVATDFEHRSLGQELALCKRYYQQFPQNPADAYGPIGVGRIRNATNAHIVLTFPEMRSSPTAAKSGNLRVLHAATGTVVNSVASSHMARSTVFIEAIVSSGLAQGEGCILTADNDSSGKITLSAEL